MLKLPPIPQSWTGLRASAMAREIDTNKRAGGETELPKRKRLRVVAKEKPEVAEKAVDRLNSKRTLDATTEQPSKKLRRTDSEILADLDEFEKQVIEDIEAEEDKKEDENAEESEDEADEEEEEEEEPNAVTEAANSSEMTDAGTTVALREVRRVFRVHLCSECDKPLLENDELYKEMRAHKRCGNGLISARRFLMQAGGKDLEGFLDKLKAKNRPLYLNLMAPFQSPDLSQRTSETKLALVDQVKSVHRVKQLTGDDVLQMLNEDQFYEIVSMPHGVSRRLSDKEFSKRLKATTFTEKDSRGKPTIPHEKPREYRKSDIISKATTCDSDNKEGVAGMIGGFKSPFGSSMLAIGFDADDVVASASSDDTKPLQHLAFKKKNKGKQNDKDSENSSAESVGSSPRKRSRSGSRNRRRGRSRSRGRRGRKSVSPSQSRRRGRDLKNESKSRGRGGGARLYSWQAKV